MTFTRCAPAFCAQHRAQTPRRARAHGAPARSPRVGGAHARLSPSRRRGLPRARVGAPSDADGAGLWCGRRRRLHGGCRGRPVVTRGGEMSGAGGAPRRFSKLRRVSRATGALCRVRGERSHSKRRGYQYHRDVHPALKRKPRAARGGNDDGGARLFAQRQPPAQLPSVGAHVRPLPRASRAGRAASGPHAQRSALLLVAGASRTNTRSPARAVSGTNRAVFVRTRGHPRVASALPARAASGINRAVFVRTRGHLRVASALPARAASGVNRAVFERTRGHPRVVEHARRQRRRIPPYGGIAAHARAPQCVGLRKTGTRASRATAVTRAVFFL
jgi:hypothetical protein